MLDADVNIRRWRDGDRANRWDRTTDRAIQDPDPWQALVQVGAQLIAALAAANDPNAAGASMDRARSSHRRAKPQNAAAAAGNRETTCQCAFGARGQLAGQGCVMGGGCLGDADLS